MAKRVIWSKRSLQDKKEIFDYWNEASRNKKYSRKLNEEINKLTDLLLLFPNLGRQIENHNARFMVKGDYIIFYKTKISSEFFNITILHIWDSRRDPEDLKL